MTAEYDPNMHPTARAVLATKATALREAAHRIVTDEASGVIFDSDHDNALVSARLHEFADEFDTISGFDTNLPEGEATA